MRKWKHEVLIIGAELADRGEKLAQAAQEMEALMDLVRIRLGARRVEFIPTNDPAQLEQMMNKWRALSGLLRMTPRRVRPSKTIILTEAIDYLDRNRDEVMKMLGVKTVAEVERRVTNIEVINAGNIDPSTLSHHGIVLIPIPTESEGDAAPQEPANENDTNLDFEYPESGHSFPPAIMNF